MTRTYAVTGSASGMGRATKQLLEGAGHRVIGIDVRAADVVADLGTEEGREAMVAAVKQASGGTLNGVVACAGVGGTPLDGDRNEPSRVKAIVRVNYFGAIATLEGLRPFLAAGDTPRAAAIASNAILAQPNEAFVEACLAGDEERAVGMAVGEANEAYIAGKTALVRWIRQMAPSPQWAGAGIALNAVCPGVIDTPMAAYLLDSDEKRERLDKDRPMPLRGPGRPEDVGSLLMWLTSPENGFATGQVVFVDGGMETVLRGNAY